jgi:hypothetical protein
MTWNPFDKPKNEIEEKPVSDEGEPEKTPAELIAESLTSGLKPLSDAITAMNQRVEAIDQRTSRFEKKPNDTERQEPISVLDDENAAFAQRLTPMFARQLELESRVVRNDVRAEYASAGYGDLWAQYEKDINETLEGSPLATGDGKPMRGDPQYIRNVVDMIMGRAARKAGMKFGGKDKGFFLETGSNGNEGHENAAADGLTDAQRRIVTRMKVPTDEAKKVLARLKFVS